MLHDVSLLVGVFTVAVTGPRLAAALRFNAVAFGAGHVVMFALGATAIAFGVMG